MSEMRSWLVWSRETGQGFGIHRATTADGAISSLLAGTGVSPYDADPSLMAKVLWSDRKRSR